MQLLRLRPAFEGARVSYVTTDRGYADDIAPARLFVVPDANRWNKLRLAIMALKILWVVARVRPHVVISTGAAPGYFAVRLGRFLGARTCWLDSIANSEELSMTGRIIEKHADLWLTQWPELSSADGPLYKGAVL